MPCFSLPWIWTEDEDCSDTLHVPTASISLSPRSAGEWCRSGSCISQHVNALGPSDSHPMQAHYYSWMQPAASGHTVLGTTATPRALPPGTDCPHALSLCMLSFSQWLSGHSPYTSIHQVTFTLKKNPQNPIFSMFKTSTVEAWTRWRRSR